MQKHLKQNLLIYIIGFSILGFVIGETIGQELEKNTPEINSHKAFGLIDTTIHPPFLSTIPPNYWYVAPTNTTNTTTSYVIPDKSKVTGIILSNNCIAVLKAKLPTNCPSYKDIVFADSSNQRLTGSFVSINGFYERLPNNFRQNLAYYYNLNNPSVIVDPPKDIIDKIPLIVIYSSLPQYADKLQDLNNTASTNTNTTSGYLTTHQYRYVEDCLGATDISYTKAILVDTIKYVQSGCTQTNLITEVDKPIKLNYTDPTKTAIYKYQQALKLEKSLVSTKDCRYVKCDVSVSGKKW